ncbi:hypothetical protein TanjilG_07662 [Lupinus angustifolius]|uniref:Uncharacterized protein n=1 Tax=Lupinus angustifolius TaxID=3871 RepID=A0A1J7G0F8_LUPAN|nr:PREDICTED: uncharacterized protein LOC109330965 [Lupinus angustifolius]OIV93759.1 hypothetical protein TanjilG_07662 [Lupinus angustifolius]
MGNCFFISSNSNPVHTVKLIIVPEGKLREFSYHVKVSSLLQKYPTTFICNSDDMDFNDVVKAIDRDQMLQLGHLYFAIPLSELERKLKAEEMVVLAVKASMVIRKSGRKKCGFRRKRVVEFSYDEGGKRSRSVASENSINVES